MRKNSLFILLLVALLSLPTFAFADASIEELSGGKGVGWQGIIASGDDAGLYGAVVRARNKYNAACWVFGKNPLTIPDEVRSKLSDPDYGGRFYEYANSFNSIIDWEYVPDWEPTYSTLSYILYGFDFQWESAVPQSLYEGAKEDFRRVLAGEDLGGGGPSSPSSGVPSGNYYKVELVNDMYPDPSGVGTRYAYIKVDYYQAMAASQLGQGRTYYLHPQWQGSDASYNFDWCSAFWTSGDPNYYRGFTSSVYVTNSRSFVSGDSFYVWSDSLPTFSGPSSFANYHPSDGHVLSLVAFDPSDWPIVYVGSPSGTWPEPTPTPTPTAPEIPTPTAPTVTPDPTPTEPTPTWPDITINIPAPPTVEVTPTGLDYTELLTRINDNLNTINSYSVSINNSLNSLRSDLVTEFDGVTQGLRNIYQYLQHLDDLLERHCKHIRDSIDENIYELELYLKGLFEWLPQQLNFDAEFTYDDSSVVNWLKQIYAKLGGGTSAPNPVADPGGFFEWLGGLIAGFIAGIVAGLPGKLQELVSDITDLTEFFPFSAPWDIYAMLLLFAHDPVTPVFSIPWGLGSGNVVNVVVDCTQWDGVMTIVRSVEKIIFAGGLAKLTFNMFKPTDVMGD